MVFQIRCYPSQHNAPFVLGVSIVDMLCSQLYGFSAEMHVAHMSNMMSGVHKKHEGSTVQLCSLLILLILLITI